MDGPHGPKGSLVSDGHGDPPRPSAPRISAKVLVPLPLRPLLLPALALACPSWDSAPLPRLFCHHSLLTPAWLPVSRDPRESQDLPDSRGPPGPR